MRLKTSLWKLINYTQIWHSQLNNRKMELFHVFICKSLIPTESYRLHGTINQRYWVDSQLSCLSSASVQKVCGFRFCSSYCMSMQDLAEHPQQLGKSKTSPQAKSIPPQHFITLLLSRLLRPSMKILIPPKRKRTQRQLLQ